MKKSTMSLAAVLAATSFAASAVEQKDETQAPTQMTAAEMAQVVAGEAGDGNAYGPGVGNAFGWDKQDPAHDPKGNAYGVRGKDPV
jgi:hypothetical protein